MTQIILFFNSFVKLHKGKIEVKSKLDEEVKVEIRKPDNSSIMPRKDSKLDNDMKLNVIDKFKKSNKLLY